jgi:hypothetical protein
MNIGPEEAGIPTESGPTRRLVPMAVGSATVYVEQIGVAAVESDRQVYPVAPPSPGEAFENAVGVIRECVHAVGKQVQDFTGELRPDELTLEFSITFNVKAKASPVPVLFTGETGAQTGLKVVAVWRRPEAAGG